MPAPVLPVLTAADRAELRRRADGAPDSPAALRARIVLLAAEGVPAVRIAERLGVARQTAAHWVSRFREGGPGALDDRPRPGRPRTRPGRRAARRASPSPTESAVTEAIRLAGVLSRVEVARRTGLTPQSVSRIVRRLIDSGLVVEDSPSRPPSAGKPRTPLRLRADAGHAVGLHLDPDVVTCVLADLEGRVLARSRDAVSRNAGAGSVVETMAAAARRMLDAADGLPVLGAGLAVPGPIDPAAGVVTDPPLLRAWRDVPVRELLAERLAGVPVVMEKDATAATIGEHWIGRAARARDFAYLYLGAGVGAGLFLRGDVHRGLSANAGEFGRLVPEGGPGAGPLPLPRALARGALALVDVLDLGLVVLGGPALDASSAEEYRAEVAGELNRHAIARRIHGVAVERSVIESEAAAVGAASSVFREAFAPRPGRG